MRNGLKPCRGLLIAWNTSNNSKSPSPGEWQPCNSSFDAAESGRRAKQNAVYSYTIDDRAQQNSLAATDPRAEWWQAESVFFFEYHSEPNGFDISFDAVAF